MPLSRLAAAALHRATAAVTPGEVVGIDLQPAQIKRARALATERGVVDWMSGE